MLDFRLKVRVVWSVVDQWILLIAVNALTPKQIFHQMEWNMLMKWRSFHWGVPMFWGLINQAASVVTIGEGVTKSLAICPKRKWWAFSIWLHSSYAALTIWLIQEPVQIGAISQDPQSCAVLHLAELGSSNNAVGGLYWSNRYIKIERLCIKRTSMCIIPCMTVWNGSLQVQLLCLFFRTMMKRLLTSHDKFLLLSQTCSGFSISSVHVGSDKIFKIRRDLIETTAPKSGSSVSTKKVSKADNCS